MDDDLLSLFNALDDAAVVREDYIRAPFGYPGAKSRSLEQILPHLPFTSKYVECFGGSGAVLLARQESKLEILNDRFAGVVAFYRCIHDSTKVRQLVERLSTIIIAREEFIWCRDTWENCTDDVERAARWYYMVQTSFTGQGRNFGRSLKSGNPAASKIRNSLEDFDKLHHRLKNVLIENLDWRQCMDDFDDEDTVFYLDPPYLNSSSGIYKCSFGRTDHIELCERIQRTRGFVALSGYDNDVYSRYKWDEKHTWKTRISITAKAFTETNNQTEKGTRSDSAMECLWIKKAK